MTVEIEDRIRSGLRTMLAVEASTAFDVRALVESGRAARRRRRLVLVAAAVAAVLVVSSSAALLAPRTSHPDTAPVVSPTVTPSPGRAQTPSAYVVLTQWLGEQGITVDDAYVPTPLGTGRVQYANVNVSDARGSGFLSVAVTRPDQAVSSFLERCDRYDCSAARSSSRGGADGWTQIVRRMPVVKGDEALSGALLLQRDYADLRVELAVRAWDAGRVPLLTAAQLGRLADRLEASVG